ncbi:MAG TPA: GGDEF domain-containing protein [Candidatus Sulfotelmatobacter sp.]|nr:GGDEF domain-containing protein [Candidatus Sulfotelmatobacter sp.]
MSIRVLNRAAAKALLVPGGILLFGVVALANSGWFTLALPALSFLYYCALVGGMLLAWRFHSSRTFLALLVLFLAQQAASFVAGQPYLPTTIQAVAVLIPINFILIALMHERGLTAESLAPVGLLLFVQSLTVAVFWGSSGRPSPLVHARHFGDPVPIARYAIVVIIAAAALLLLRFLLTRKPVESALFWSLCSIALALRSTEMPRTSTLYWAAAACILAVSIVENSYLLAYHDELTTLPSRRAFNDALLRLKDPYSIAVVDIDHFKRFNDTYGHDTGDQVLRLVAGKLARVTGGGEAYRCGGEEFMILFPGKNTSDVVEHLEGLRRKVESAEFRVRGNDRRQAPRGPDRRNERARARTKRGHIIRQLAEEKSNDALSVTVSIGVATSTESSDTESVLKAADKALYRAKENGRNRVETTSPVRRTRSKTAGIA